MQHYQHTIVKITEVSQLVELDSCHQNTICKLVSLHQRLFELVCCLKEADEETELL